LSIDRDHRTAGDADCLQYGYIFQASIPLTSFLTTWGVRDLTVGGAFAHVTNFDPAGSLRKFSTVDGRFISVTYPSYSVFATRYLPTKLAAVGSQSVMTLFGERYLSQLNALSGQVVWIKDVGLTKGYTTYLPTDIAAIGAP
jgi:hypothetical protein